MRRTECQSLYSRFASGEFHFCSENIIRVPGACSRLPQNYEQRREMNEGSKRSWHGDTQPSAIQNYLKYGARDPLLRINQFLRLSDPIFHWRDLTLEGLPEWESAISGWVEAALQSFQRSTETVGVSPANEKEKEKEKEEEKEILKKSDAVVARMSSGPHLFILGPYLFISYWAGSQEEIYLTIEAISLLNRHEIGRVTLPIDPSARRGYLRAPSLAYWNGLLVFVNGGKLVGLDIPSCTVKKEWCHPIVQLQEKTDEKPTEEVDPLYGECGFIAVGKNDKYILWGWNSMLYTMALDNQENIMPFYIAHNSKKEIHLSNFYVQTSLKQDTVVLTAHFGTPTSVVSEIRVFEALNPTNPVKVWSFRGCCISSPCIRSTDGYLVSFKESTGGGHIMWLGVVEFNKRSGWRLSEPGNLNSAAANIARGTVVQMSDDGRYLFINYQRKRKREMYHYLVCFDTKLHEKRWELSLPSGDDVAEEMSEPYKGQHQLLKPSTIKLCKPVAPKFVHNGLMYLPGWDEAKNVPLLAIWDLLSNDDADDDSSLTEGDKRTDDCVGHPGDSPIDD